MTSDAQSLRWRLQRLGLSDSAIKAAWPSWWSDDAEQSPSAQAELRFSLSRKLGLDPRSLLDEGEPKFVWRDEARYKNLSTESDIDRAAITSFGVSLARALVAGVAEKVFPLEGVKAEQLRHSILARKPYVRLIDLLGLCWAIGIPVIHLRVFPLTTKRMCAMAVRVGGQFAILLGKDAEYPASIAYYLAHEIGHAALGHLHDGAAIVDLQDPLKVASAGDNEEQSADQYALELLTGSSRPTVLTDAKQYGTRQLAKTILMSAEPLHIEPGTLALCFGYSTGDWEKANAAMKSIYTDRRPVWREINRLAASRLNWNAMPEDTVNFLRAVMGGIGDEGGS